MSRFAFFRALPAYLLLALALTACGGAPAPAGSSSAQPADSAQTPPPVDYSLGLEEDGRYAGVAALDYVTLPEDYRALPAGEEYLAVDAASVQAAVDAFMEQFSVPVQITDRPVAAGDRVNIDYVGSIDGVPFAGGDTQGAGADYTAGSEELIDGFLTQIIGAAVGETVEVHVTFPDPYPGSPDLSGKPALFVTTVNSITEEQVPELTDAFVAENLTQTLGYTDAADLRRKMADSLLEEHQYNYVLDWLYDNSAFQPVPDAVVENQTAILEAELRAAAAGSGVEVDEMVSQYYGQESLEALLEHHRPNLENLIQQNLMCQALAEAEGIEVDDAALRDYFSRTMDVDDYSSYEAQYGRGYLSQLAQMDLAARYLMDHAAA